MRVLAIVDIHKSENALDTTIHYLNTHKPDLLLIAGDITTFGPLEFAETFLDNLPDIKTLALPGNCDPREILGVLDNSKAQNLHGRKEVIQGITFVGLGGSNQTPFNTPFELTEDEIFQTLDNIMEPGAVLVLHFPVMGHLDEVPGGIHTGSTGAHKIVEKYKPGLVISGHIHETTGTKTDEKGIIYLNPGPIGEGYGALVDIEKIEDVSAQEQVRYNFKIQLLSPKDKMK